MNQDCKIFEGTFTEWHKYLHRQIEKDLRKIKKLEKFKNNAKLKNYEIVQRV